MDLSRKRRFTLIHHLFHPLKSWISSFFHPTMECSFSSQFSLFFFQEKKWKLRGHLSIFVNQHIISWPAGQLVYALKCNIWLTFLTDIVCGASSCKIIEFHVRCRHRICIKISSSRELSRYAIWCAPHLLCFAFPGPFIHQDCNKKRENLL